MTFSQSSLEISTSTKSHRTTLFEKSLELKVISTGYIVLDAFAQAQTNEIVHSVSKSPLLIVTFFQTFKYFIFSEFTSSLTIFSSEVAMTKAIAHCHIVLHISIFLAIITQS
ncbi:MAG: hypothetical protein LBC61_03435 [Candidatus Peribacteria bacterium]|jgi:hypothetical protein|nr:hypothetical protein [Candidatus Peribacteria bacterium]